jgi:hypothetical protein
VFITVYVFLAITFYFSGSCLADCRNKKKATACTGNTTPSQSTNVFSMFSFLFFPLQFFIREVSWCITDFMQAESFCISCWRTK